MSYTENFANLNAAGRDCIRLFKILHNRSECGQNMRCQARVFPLTLAPRYSALSYCWQTRDESEPVELQGCLRGTKMISRDLISALQAAHSRFTDDWLWVDAICIDQSQNDEKNDQVPRMQAFYESADRVLVWLGEEFPDSELENRDGTRYSTSLTAFGFTRGKILQLCDDALAGRAWWTRVWVIQEMVVARKLHVCIGSHLLQWDKFVQGTQAWRQADYGAGLSDSKVRIQQLDRLRKDWWKAKHSLDLLQLLDRGRQSYATDARDNIYGLLGLMNPEDRKGVCVDYNRSTRHVYAETTLMLFRRQQNLDFLVKAFSYKSPRSEPGLPSWVLDFGDCQQISDVGHLAKHEIDGIKDAFEDGSRHGASAGRIPLARMHPSSLKLEFCAVVFDCVVARTTKIPGEWVSGRQSPTQTIEDARNWLRSASNMLKASLLLRALQPVPGGQRRWNDKIKSLLIDVCCISSRYSHFNSEETLRSAFANLVEDDFTSSKWFSASPMGRHYEDTFDHSWIPIAKFC
ncbi:hypothetical protein G7054_g2943 [Neopestalotiopsis clavispora]|nr:hypothetical protein G7054_g2943 [Neopestalotiopsis clavispora]